MSQSIRIAAVAALFGSLAFAPAFAQDAAATSCSDFNSMTPEQQAETTDAIMMEALGADGAEATNEEVTSMLLEKCEEFPDTPAIDQFNELPLAVQE